jgi:hypothetical protein
MNTTAQIRPPWTPSGPKQPTDPRRGARATASERPTFGETFAETVPLLEFIPGYGPPAVYVLGPWLFLVLMLAGPFACLFALVVVMIVAATVLAALTAAILATLAAPYLLVRHLRRHLARHASISAPAAPSVAIESPRVAT